MGGRGAPIIGLPSIAKRCGRGDAGLPVVGLALLVARLQDLGDGKLLFDEDGCYGFTL